jgi:hypothetical protein
MPVPLLLELCLQPHYFFLADFLYLNEFVLELDELVRIVVLLLIVAGSTSVFKKVSLELVLIMRAIDSCLISGHPNDSLCIKGICFFLFGDWEGSSVIIAVFMRMLTIRGVFGVAVEQ